MAAWLAELVPLWWRWVAPLSLQGALVLGIVLLIDLALPRRTPPSLRLLLWLLGLLRLVVPPTLASPVAAARLLPGALADPGARLRSMPADRLVDGASWIVWIWLAGLVIVAGWSLLRHALLRRRLERESRDQVVPDWLDDEVHAAAGILGSRRPPRVALHPRLASPLVIGLVRPLVLLPSDIRREEARPALLHELAHLRRRDLHLMAGLALLQAIYWFHPLVWWARRRLAALVEQCCDRTVARRLGAEAAGYRRALLHFAARQHGLSSAGLSFYRPRSLLLTRLDLLASATLERPWRTRLVGVALTLTVLACLIPTAPAAQASIATVVDVIERPPGCLPLRYQVLWQMAIEDGYLPPPSEAASDSLSIELEKETP